MGVLFFVQKGQVSYETYLEKDALRWYDGGDDGGCFVGLWQAG